jgi:hypothetical protein
VKRQVNYIGAEETNAVIDPSPIIAPGFQLLSAVASVGRVRTKSYVVSRRFNALALGAVTADFAIKYLCTARADHLVGLVVFTILTARTLLLLCFETIEAEVSRRRLTCAAAFFACAVASVASELAATGSLALVTLLPIVGIGLGCLGEASNAMVVRRRCVLAMGCIMSLFAISTSAWGLVFKNTISDVGASIWSMIKSRDPPLPALASVIAVIAIRFAQMGVSAIPCWGKNKVGCSRHNSAPPRPTER